MGIRKLLVLSLGATFISQMAYADMVDTIMNSCISRGGKVKQEIVSSSATQNCYNILCYEATAGIGNVNFDSIQDFFNKSTQERGAAQIAFDKNKCVKNVGHDPSKIYTKLTNTHGNSHGHSHGANGTGKASDGHSHGADGKGWANGHNHTGSVNGGGHSSGGHGGGHHGGGHNGKVNGGSQQGDGHYVSSSGVHQVGSSKVYRYTHKGNKYETTDSVFAEMCLKKKFILNPKRVFTKWNYTLINSAKCTGSHGSSIAMGGHHVDHHIGRQDQGHGHGRGSGNGGGGGGHVRTSKSGGGGGHVHSGGGSRGNGRGRGHGRVSLRDNRCSYDRGTRGCIGNDRYSDLYIRRDEARDCPTCGHHGRSSRSSGASGIINAFANIAGAVAGPLAYYHSNRKWSNAHASVGIANANAIATGYEQCQLMQTNYVNNTYSYLQTNELPDRSVLPPECNGYNLGSFSGSQGFSGSFGSFGNAFYSAGYSPQFMAGMTGPNGQGLFPNFNVTGGVQNPNWGLQNQNGININANFNNPLGFNNGFGMNGQAGVRFPGFNGNYNTPGFNGNYNRPGFNGNYNRPGFNGNFNVGWPPGVNANANGLVNWPNNNRASYYQNTSPQFNNTWNGNGRFNGQFNSNSRFNNQFNNNSRLNGQFNGQLNGGSQAGFNYQSAALQNQYNIAGQNLSNHYSSGGLSAHGSVPYSPSNMGITLSGGLNLGF